MIIKHKEQRVGVLIDVQNMYHSAKNLFKAKVDFNKVLKKAVADRKLVRAIAYVVSTEGGEEKTFFKALTRFCLLYTSPSPRDATLSRMPSSA